MKTSEVCISKKLKLLIVLVISVCMVLGILIYPSIYAYICKNRVENVKVEKNQNDLLHATIRIIRVEENNDGISYSPGTGGVIFAREGMTTYYALTAYHVVSGKENNSWLVQTSFSPSRIQYEEEVGWVSNSEYYNSFPKASVEYIDEEYDLAIIRFESEEVLYTLDIAETDPVKGEDVVLLGPPSGKEVAKYYGKITSKKYIQFVTDDGRLPNMVLKHSAYSEPGSSGAAILNKDDQIVGINIGGGTDGFGRYRYGVMSPCIQIKQFVEDWSRQKGVTSIRAIFATIAKRYLDTENHA